MEHSQSIEKFSDVSIIVPIRLFYSFPQHFHHDLIRICKWPVVYIYFYCIYIITLLKYKHKENGDSISSILLLQQITIDLMTLNSTKLIILPFWRSEIWHPSHRAKIKVSAGLCCFLEAPWDNPFFCFFQLLEAICISAFINS